MPRSLEEFGSRQNLPVGFSEWNPGGRDGERVLQGEQQPKTSLGMKLGTVLGFMCSNAYTNIGVPL